jgi:hypothetical protein
VAAWRSRAFGSIEASCNAFQKAALFREISEAIEHIWLDMINPLPGGPIPSLPPAFTAGIENILEMAYEWNRMVKMEIVKYDFEPAVVQPLSRYDPETMEPFERLRQSVRTGGKVVSSVSLGLNASVALGGTRVSHVQHKTKVLVEEWFFPVRKKPITMQPKSAPPMSMYVKPRPGHQDPPPPKKGCCG